MCNESEDIKEKDLDKENNPSEKPGKRTFWEEVKHAFSMKVAEDEFNENDLKLIDNIAKDLVNRRLAAPAILFLVSLKPVSFLMAQGMHFLRPFTPSPDTASTGKDFAEKFALKTLFTEPGAYERFSLLFENRECVELLIESLEKQEDERLRKERKLKTKEKRDKNSTDLKNE